MTDSSFNDHSSDTDTYRKSQSSDTSTNNSKSKYKNNYINKKNKDKDNRKKAAPYQLGGEEDKTSLYLYGGMVLITLFTIVYMMIYQEPTSNTITSPNVIRCQLIDDTYFCKENNIITRYLDLPLSNDKKSYRIVQRGIIK